MFQNSGFEQLEIQTALYDGSRGRAPMYLRDTVQFLREQLSVLDNTENFIFRPVEKKLRADGAAFQCSSMKTAQFLDIY